MSLRPAVLAKLRMLAPIMAHRGIKLEGLSEQELRDLLTCLQHVEGRIQRAENLNRRQPWRRGF